MLKEEIDYGVQGLLCWILVFLHVCFIFWGRVFCTDYKTSCWDSNSLFPRVYEEDMEPTSSSFKLHFLSSTLLFTPSLSSLSRLLSDPVVYTTVERRWGIVHFDWCCVRCWFCTTCWNKESDWNAKAPASLQVWKHLNVRVGVL